MSDRIADATTIMKHADVILWVNTLIIDLKLELMGQPHKPITMERLNEWTHKHDRNLSECKERMLHY